MADAIIEMKKVYKTFTMGKSAIEVLKGVDLTIEKGEFVSIMGPSGSGKSTIMNLVGLLDRPTSGVVLIGGKQTQSLGDSALSALRSKHIGFVFQSFHLIPRFNVLTNVELPMYFQGMPDRRRAEIAKRHLEDVGLADRILHRPNALSGGERQRVALARALVNDPEVLLADEPTGNLDPATGREVMRIFSRLNAMGKTIVMVTHDQDIAAYGNRIVRIKDGMALGQETR